MQSASQAYHRFGLWCEPLLCQSPAAGKWAWLISGQVLSHGGSSGKRLEWDRDEQMGPLPPSSIHIWKFRQLGVTFFFHIPWVGEVQAREAKMLAHLGFNHAAWWPVTFKSRRNCIKDFSCWTIAPGSSTQCLKYFGSLSLLTSMKDVLTFSELHSSTKNESIADTNFCSLFVR